MSKAPADIKKEVLVYRKEVGNRLREVEKRFANRAEAARSAGVAKSTLQNWIEGKTDPSFLGIVRLAQAADVDVAWLITGEGKPDEALNPEQVRLLSGDKIRIPRYDRRSLAPPGELNPSYVVDFVYFAESWIRRLFPGDPARLAFITADSDSMEPTIRSGDIVLIDTDIKSFVDEGIYVVGVDGPLLLRRIQFLIDGTVVLKNDNPAYENERLYAQAASEANVVGRVRWIGRIL